MARLRYKTAVLHILREVNWQINKGMWLDPKELSTHANAGDLLPWLENTLTFKDHEFSLSPMHGTGILEDLSGAISQMDSRHHQRHMKNGLCIVVEYCLSLIGEDDIEKAVAKRIIGL